MSPRIPSIQPIQTIRDTCKALDVMDEVLNPFPLESENGQQWARLYREIYELLEQSLLDCKEEIK